MSNKIFEKLVGTAIVITGLVVVERKLEKIAFDGLNNLFKDKEQTESDTEPAE